MLDDVGVGSERPEGLIRDVMRRAPAAQCNVVRRVLVKSEDCNEEMEENTKPVLFGGLRRANAPVLQHTGFHSRLSPQLFHSRQRVTVADAQRPHAATLHLSLHRAPHLHQVLVIGQRAVQKQAIDVRAL